MNFQSSKMRADCLPVDEAPDSNRNLAISVIHRAINDLECALTGRIAKNKRHKNTNSTTQKEAEEAINFLTESAGGWSDSRKIWCECAGIDDKSVRDYAIRRITENKGCAATLRVYIDELSR